ncbi:MAG: LamG domain-containing protein [Planctomycetes bacterium]|jgi:hypothetical protein|nr:LamG domain-containing protein [Planctomycetota bacterium]
MLRTALTVSLSLTLAAPTTAQDLLLYKFEGACTNEVINYAPFGLGNGTLQVGVGTGFAPGYVGEALGGGNTFTNVRNLVLTGWDPSVDPITTNLTLALWARQATNVTTTPSYFCGMDNSGFRLFTSGAAGNGVYLRSTGSALPDLLLPDTVTNFVALAATNWVHLAVTIDGGTGTAIWYVNGSSVLTVPGYTGLNISGPGEFVVGGYAITGDSSHHVDEFLLSRRLYTAAEIALLANGTRAGVGTYTSGSTTQCNSGVVTIDTVGGRPAIGNLTHGIRITAAAPSLWLLLYGETRCTFAGSLPLPLAGATLLPQLNGCTILADAPILLSGFTTGPGAPAIVPLPITATTPMGAWAWCQALTIQLGSNAIAMSDGLAISVGN